jgi:hypothetical protein
MCMEYPTRMQEPNAQMHDTLDARGIGAERDESGNAVLVHGNAQSKRANRRA